MAVRTIDRRASDNKYLHRDFHTGGDNSLIYIGEQYGEEGVHAYVQQATRAYYIPLMEAMRNEGLIAMERHLQNIYEIEEATDALSTVLIDDELMVEISYCPAITYMKSVGHTVSQWYIHFTSTVFETIANDTGCCFELKAYDTSTGKAKYRFFKNTDGTKEL